MGRLRPKGGKRPACNIAAGLKAQGQAMLEMAFEIRASPTLPCC